MNKVRLAIHFVITLAVIFAVTSCGKDEVKSGKFRVGIAYSTAGKRDASYSEAAAAGITVAKQQLNIDVSEVEPAQLSDLEPALVALSRSGAQLVVAVSYYYSDPLRRVAAQFPKVNYVIIDGDVSGIPNVRSILFRAEQGAFLVGAIAGLYTKSNIVGVVAAIDMPILNTFVAGYKCGAETTNANVRVEHNYIGTGPEAFNDRLKGSEVAKLQISRGADVIFQVAAASGIGVINAAQEAGIVAIGVDSDQSSVAPGAVLTSMLKRVDLAVKVSIEDALHGQFKGGVMQLGIEDKEPDFVDYVLSSSNDQFITPTIKNRVEGLRQQIRQKNIVVPQTLAEPCASAARKL